jgi:hypothetical protein
MGKTVHGVVTHSPCQSLPIFVVVVIVVIVVVVVVVVVVIVVVIVVVVVVMMNILCISSYLAFWATAPKGSKPSHLITCGHSFRPSIRTSLCTSVHTSVHTSVCAVGNQIPAELLP